MAPESGGQIRNPFVAKRTRKIVLNAPDVSFQRPTKEGSVGQMHAHFWIVCLGCLIRRPMIMMTLIAHFVVLVLIIHVDFQLQEHRNAGLPPHEVGW